MAPLRFKPVVPNRGALGCHLQYSGVPREKTFFITSLKKCFSKISSKRSRKPSNSNSEKANVWSYSSQLTKWTRLWRSTKYIWTVKRSCDSTQPCQGPQRPQRIAHTCTNVWAWMKNLMTSYKWTLPLQQHHISQLFSRGTRIMLSWGRQNIWRRFWCNLFLMTTAWQGSHYESMKLMVYGKLWCQTTRCQRWNHHSQLPKHLTFVSVTRKVWRHTEQKSENDQTSFELLRILLNCGDFIQKDPTW